MQIIKKKLIFCITILLVLFPLVYAGNYGSGTYGIDNYGVGEIISTPTSNPPSGRSSTCTYDWQCTEWFPSICPESGIQERVCANKGTCSGIKGMPNQTQTCEYFGPTEPLFDIYLSLSEYYKEVCAGNKIKANIKLENYAKVELLDAFMTYWITDENNKLIAELKDTRAVEKETNFNIEIKIPDSTSEGTYKLYAKITYNGNKTAVTGESFEVLSEKDCKFLSIKMFNWMYLVYGIIILLLVLLFIKIFRKRKKKPGKQKTHKEYKNKIKQNLKKIKTKHFLIVLAGFMLIGILFIGGRSMTGFIMGDSISGNVNWRILGFVLIIGVLGLLFFTYRKKIIRKIKRKEEKKYSKNSLKGLIKKKVYAEEGNYVGKVEEVLLGKNKIDNLKIKLDKKQKFKVKGIVVKYKDVKSVGHIVIIDESILKKLNI